MSATSSENHIVRAGLGNTACSGDNISGANVRLGGTGSVLADVGRGGGGGNLFAQLGGAERSGSRRSSVGYAPDTVEDVFARRGLGSQLDPVMRDRGGPEYTEVPVPCVQRREGSASLKIVHRGSPRQEGGEEGGFRGAGTVRSRRHGRVPLDVGQAWMVGMEPGTHVHVNRVILGGIVSWMIWMMSTALPRAAVGCGSLW